MRCRLCSGSRLIRSLGPNRCQCRVLIYVVLMRDEYPPFHLDQGGPDVGALGRNKPVVEPGPLGIRFEVRRRVPRRRVGGLVGGGVARLQSRIRTEWCPPLDLRLSD